MNNKAHLRPEDFDRYGDIIPMSWKEEKGDLISRRDIKDHISELALVYSGEELVTAILNAIDNAQSVEKPKGEREFIGILTQYVPDDICTYPEYKGKPYYSIHYKEKGEEFVGFGTYNPEVLSRYLKEYFMKGGAI